MAKRRGITKRTDGRYQAIIELGYEGGQRKRKYVYGATEREVLQKKRELEAQIHAGILPTRGDITVAALMEEWLKREVRSRLRYNSIRTYEYLVYGHIVPGMGDLRLSRVDTYAVQVFLDDTCTAAAGLAPDTVSKIRKVLKQAWDKAVDWEWAGRNPVEKTRPPAPDPSKIDGGALSLSPAEARCVLDACAGHRLGRVPLLMLATGVRVNEALGLRWQDVDLVAGEAQIREQLQYVPGRGLILAPLKTATSRRVVGLPDFAIEALREQREEQRILGAEGDMDLVFTGSGGNPVADETVWRVFSRLLEDAGLPHLRLHDLRHVYTSLMAGQGTPPRDLMDALGHSRLSMTIDTYTRPLPGARARAAQVMDKILGGDR